MCPVLMCPVFIYPKMIQYTSLQSISIAHDISIKFTWYIDIALDYVVNLHTQMMVEYRVISYLAYPGT